MVAVAALARRTKTGRTDMKKARWGRRIVMFDGSEGAFTDQWLNCQQSPFSLESADQWNIDSMCGGNGDGSMRQCHHKF